MSSMLESFELCCSVTPLTLESLGFGEEFAGFTRPTGHMKIGGTEGLTTGGTRVDGLDQDRFVDGCSGSDPVAGPPTLWGEELPAYPPSL